MSLLIKFSDKPSANTDTAVIAVYNESKPGTAFNALDKECKGFLSHALSKTEKFQSRHGQSLCVSLPPDAPYERAILFGLGKPTKLDNVRAEEAGGKLYLALEATGSKKAALLGDIKNGTNGLRDYDIMAHIAMGAHLRSYTFDHYKTKDKKDNPKPVSLHMTTPHYEMVKKAFLPMESAADGVYLARNLVNEPPNTLTPDVFAQRIKAELKPLGVEVEIINEKKLAKMKAGGILAVGQGSVNPPRMVVMRWNGKKKPKARYFGLVGKGVTFDTGGISLKPGKDMDEMKMDMGGAAAVVGAMKSIALRKAKANVVGIVGLVENMPSGTAYRPGDIITSLSGKTIEILNTDAEGRLVLADALTHIQRTYNPESIIDLATLTGAVMVALGTEYCGTYTEDEKLWKSLEAAGKTSNEKIWRMPLDKAWSKAVESDIADLRNLSKLGAHGGSCTAAAFLQAFIDQDQSWCHMDIAGTAWSKSAKDLSPKYATGFGVRILDRFIADNFEE